MKSGSIGLLRSRNKSAISSILEYPDAEFTIKQKAVKEKETHKADAAHSWTFVITAAYLYNADLVVLIPGIIGPQSRHIPSC